MVINALCLVLSEVEAVLAPDLLLLSHPGGGAGHQVQGLPDVLVLQALVVLPRGGILSAGKVRVVLQMDFLVDLNFIFDVS